MISRLAGRSLTDGLAAARARVSGRRGNLAAGLSSFSPAAGGQPFLLEHCRRDKIVVRKEGRFYVCRAFRQGKQFDAFTATDSETIFDHIGATWPPGTRAQWIVRPPVETPTEPRPLIQIFSLLRTHLGSIQ